MAVIQASAGIGGGGSLSAPGQHFLADTAVTPATTVPTSASGNILATTRMIVPLLALPSQILQIELNNQSVNLNVYQRTTGLYVDVGINNLLIIGGVRALDRVKIVRDAYLGFVGDLAFWDSMGLEEPNWTELGTRYFLGYFYPT